MSFLLSLILALFHSGGSLCWFLLRTLFHVGKWKMRDVSSHCFTETHGKVWKRTHLYTLFHFAAWQNWPQIPTGNTPLQPDAILLEQLWLHYHVQGQFYARCWGGGWHCHSFLPLLYFHCPGGKFALQRKHICPKHASEENIQVKCDMWVKLFILFLPLPTYETWWHRRPHSQLADIWKDLFLAQTTRLLSHWMTSGLLPLPC